MKIAIYKHPYSAFISAVLRGRRHEVTIISNVGNRLLDEDYDCIVMPDTVDDCSATAPQVRLDINASAKMLFDALQSTTLKKTEETP